VLDLVIRNGRVVDGTGAPAFIADVGIRGTRIVEIGEVAESARRVIDAEGKVVSPGFIDVHTHYDAQTFWDPTLAPSSLHGVTTTMGGNCGFSIAPITEDAAGYIMRMLARVEGMPLAALQSGVPWNWRTMAEYFDRIEDGLAINAGFMVGHAAVRSVVMGEAATEREATDDELEAMKAEVHAALAAGAVGFSSTNAESHNDAEGRPVPPRHAAPHELIELAGVCSHYPGTSLEFIPKLGPTFPPDQVELMIAMSAAARRPVNWNLLRPKLANLEQCRRKLEAGDRARSMGAKIVALVLPEDSLFLFNFFTGFVLDALPGWGAPMALPYEEKLHMLSSAEGRALLTSIPREPEEGMRFDWGEFEIFETFTPETAQYKAQVVRDVAARQGKSAFDALVDIACADGLRTTFFRPPDMTKKDWDAREEILRDPRTIVGGSDAGAHLDSIDSFSYATRFLARYVRKDERFSLEEAIRMLTGHPAAFYGLRERGVLRAGAAADIVVFDIDEIGPGEVTSNFDLPAGGVRLYAESTGIEHVVVNGEPIIEAGTFTEARPGKVVKSGRDTHDSGMV
jgi:N-acyl-D-aspartate/D-glutamate deacylase